ncbi:MAG: hypothetical protein JWP14_3244 [Frankiales bacterium]|nr:hypothetical protein [Frankiales bacterium]
MTGQSCLPSIGSELTDSVQRRLVARATRGLVENQAGPADWLGRHPPPDSQGSEASTVVELVALMELYSVERLLERCPNVNGVSGTWHGRKRDWKRFVSVELDKFADWQKLLGFVAARNAFQHGHGRLTDQQLDKYRDDTLLNLTAAHVHRNGDRIAVGPADVKRCLSVALGFIDYVESHI